MRLKVYIAGIITGAKTGDVFNYFDNMKKTLEDFGYDVFTPVAGKDMCRTEKNPFGSQQKIEIPQLTNHAIVERDRWMVKNSDIIFCDLSGKDTASIGCTAELAWAHDNGVHSVVILPEEHVMRHAFILEMADVLFNNREDALIYMDSLI